MNIFLSPKRLAAGFTRCLCIITCLILASCAAPPSRSCPEEADRFIIATNGRAQYFDHRPGGREFESGKERDAALKSRLDEIGQHLDSTAGEVELLVYIHGGLVSSATGIDGARTIYKNLRTTQALSGEGNAGRKIVPLFVTWDTGLPSSFWSSLAYEQAGVGYRNRQNKFIQSLPGVLIELPANLGTGVSRSLHNIWQNSGKVLQNSLAYRVTPGSFPTRQLFFSTLQHDIKPPCIPYGTANEVDLFSKGFSCAPAADGQVRFPIGLGSYRAFNPMEVTWNTPYAPTKIGLSPFYDGVGTPAWKNMVRRSRTLVSPYPTLADKLDSDGSLADITEGPLSIIFRHIAEWDKTRPEMKITVAGHSMGTMVLNEVFREMRLGAITGGRAAGGQVDIDRIIYMAAACSIRDFVDNAGAYTLARPKTQFYNCTLNPACEYTEKFRPNIVLTGSLLVWIDEFFEQPVEFGGRTFGSFENCVIAWRDLPNMPRFHLRAYSQAAKGVPAIKAGPQKHGEFDNYHFWQDKFLDPKYAAQHESELGPRSIK